MSFHDVVSACCLERLGRPPELDAPRGYNDKIQWLKLYDQMPEHIVCCDKIAVRDYVAERVGSQYLVDLYHVADSFGSLPWRVPAMVKASHDSGSAMPAFSDDDRKAIGKRMTKRLAKVYGGQKGEWAYSHVEPKLLSERLLPLPVTDYKFHCVNGRIRWVQIISERGAESPLEVNTDEQGRPIGLHLDHEFRCTHDRPALSANWSEMADLARLLSKPFRYVRVDLYSVNGRAYFGELTFWPRAGFYMTPDEEHFGDLLDFDLSFKREPIHH